MSELTFSPRCADSSDLEQILGIERVCYPEPWSADHFVAEMSKPYARVMVLTDDETDETVVGYIIYWLQVEGVSLLNVCVHPKFRGLQFGKRLMSIMINEAVREDIPKITLEVRASNETAIQLYDDLGFKKTHERKNFYSDGETAFVMESKTSEASSTLH